MTEKCAENNKKCNKNPNTLVFGFCGFIKNNRAPKSVARCFGPPVCPLPSVAAAEPQSNHRCQNPSEADAEGTQRCCLWEVDCGLAVGDWAAPAGVLVCVCLEGQGAVIPLPDFVDASRPAGEYIDYTWYHLPVFPKNTEAMLASFAARMAFSNL